MPSSQQHRRTTIDLGGLIEWYQQQCDGDWEHSFGVKLDTLDNPGWSLTVDLKGTELEGRSMPTLSEGCDSEGGADDGAWIYCTIQENQFQGACDPTQLVRLFEAFDTFRLHSPDLSVP